MLICVLESTCMQICRYLHALIHYYFTITSDIVTDSRSGGAAWVVKLKAMPPGGPYVVRATVGSETIELKDVLFGDVWLCGGQSNMQFGVSQVGAHLSYNIF